MPTGEQETPYKDLDYEAILNMDYGYRTEATIAQNAKDIAREHNLDELSVKEELDRINQFQQKDKETREEEIVEQKEQEKNQEVGQVDKKIEESTQSIQKPLIIEQLEKEIQQWEKTQEIETNKNHSPSPKEKIEIAQNTITELNNNSPLVKEAIETELSKQTFQEEINELLIEKEYRNNQAINPQNQENTTNPLDKINSQETRTEENKFTNLSDEELEEKIKELEAKRGQEEEHLKEIVMQFTPKDIAELLQQLYKLDKSLSQIIETEQTKQLAESENKMREFQKLLEKDKLEALTKIVGDISDKYIQLQSEKEQILESKKEYEALNQLMENKEKPEIIQERIQRIHKELPNFKKDYPNTIKKATEYPKEYEKSQSKPQEKGISL
ncbi:hypothetical protein LS72_005185 [Helicobacter apodemus]|uniref:Uncharacterized protein n=1 Tax=Helicobacter apodemus TaxID=135569 RepID=A0A4V6YSR1_9HELI|nr:hypothetical protein [Helicobacter apodemus]TLE15954.1 hypothetical protein LS72_005185 [Helicobacter apodemus]